MMRSLIIAALVLIAAALPAHTECFKSPEAAWAQLARPAWAVRMGSGCWRGTVDKPTVTRGNRGHHKHRKEAMPPVRATQYATKRSPETRPRMPVYLGTSGAVIPIFQPRTIGATEYPGPPGQKRDQPEADDLSSAINKCTAEWDKRHGH